MCESGIFLECNSCFLRGHLQHEGRTADFGCLRGKELHLWKRTSRPIDTGNCDAMATETGVDQTAKKLSPVTDCPYRVDRDSWCIENTSAPQALHLTVIVLGATGDLAAKKTFPALAALHSRGYVHVPCSRGRPFLDSLSSCFREFSFDGIQLTLDLSHNNGSAAGMQSEEVSVTEPVYKASCIWVSAPK